MSDALQPKTNSKAALRRTIEQWIDQHPKAFCLDKNIPLKKGILDDLFAAYCPTLSRKHVRLAICYYTNDFKYQEAIAQSEDKIRYDLDGNPAGEIIDAEDHYARKQLKRIKAMHRQAKEDKLNKVASNSSLHALEEKFNQTDSVL